MRVMPPEGKDRWGDTYGRSQTVHEEMPMKGLLSIRKEEEWLRVWKPQTHHAQLPSNSAPPTLKEYFYLKKKCHILKDKIQ